MLCGDRIQPCPHVLRLVDHARIDRTLSQTRHASDTSPIDLSLVACTLHLWRGHQTAINARVQFTEVQGVITLAVHASMLYLGRNLMVNDRLLIFGDDVNAKL